MAHHMWKRVLIWSGASLLAGPVAFYLASAFGPLGIVLPAVWMAVAGHSVASHSPPVWPAWARLMVGGAFACLTLALIVTGLAGSIALFSLGCEPNQYECPL